MTLTPERIKELSDRHLRVVGAGYVRPQVRIGTMARVAGSRSSCLGREPAAVWNEHIKNHSY